MNNAIPLGFGRLRNRDPVPVKMVSIPLDEYNKILSDAQTEYKMFTDKRANMIARINAQDKEISSMKLEIDELRYQLSK